MSLVNHVNIIGNLGKDPEVRYTSSGLAVANLSVATNERRGTGAEQREYTEWHRVIAFGPLAEMIGKIYSKGKQVAIEGRLQTREWTDKNDVRRWTTEIVASFAKLLGPAPATAQGPPVDVYDNAASTPAPAKQATTTDVPPGVLPEPDDDIPF